MSSVKNKGKGMVYMTFTVTNPELAADLHNRINIDLIVGNGFDIRVLKRLNQQPTTFSNFYDWEMKRANQNQSSIILNIMKIRKDEFEDWSDIEEAITIAVCENKYDIKDIIQSVQQIQEDFADFLNSIVTPEMLNLTNIIANKKSVKKSVKHLLVDDSFVEKTLYSFGDDVLMMYNEKSVNEIFGIIDHYDLMNWSIFNFNYTYLLDNYLKMAFQNFDPHMYFQSKMNSYFRIPPTRKPSDNREQTIYSTFLHQQVFHPHGSIGIPSGMLFGYNSIDQLHGSPVPPELRYRSQYKLEQQLAKSYLAQDEINYGPYLAEAELFIVFGSSLGRSDAWWWEHILQRLCVEFSLESLSFNAKKQDTTHAIYSPKLIIYWFGPSLPATPKENPNAYAEIRKQVLARILAFLPSNTNAELRKRIYKQIFVIPFGPDTKLTAFQI
jgi:hypothetical protein